LTSSFGNSEQARIREPAAVGGWDAFACALRDDGRAARTPTTITAALTKRFTDPPSVREPSAT
jgi:hypothetical protein